MLFWHYSYSLILVCRLGEGNSITRKLEQDTVVKRIRITKDCEIFHFEERVKAFSASELTDFMHNAGLEVTGIKGDYNLSEYEPQSSDRMIIIAKKPMDI